MLDISSAKVKKVIIHYVGNKLRDEGILLSKAECDRTSALDEILLRDFLAPTIRGGEEYILTHESDIALNTISHYASCIFFDEKKFKSSSDSMAKHLYSCSGHPNIGGGEFLEVLFEGIQDEGLPRQAIGLFRAESKSTYLDIEEKNGTLRIFEKAGISVEKIQKGAIILSESRKTFVIDNLSQKTKYWVENFLKATSTTTPKKCAQAAGAVLKAISSKVESPRFALEFAQQIEHLLAEGEALSIADLKQASTDFINDDQLNAILDGARIKYGISLEDDLTIECSQLTKYAREVITKARIADGISLIISNPDARLRSVEIKPIKSGFRATLDIQLKEI